MLERAELSRRGGESCRYQPAAVTGGTSSPGVLAIEGDPYDDVTWSSRLTLRGPAGTPYYR